MWVVYKRRKIIELPGCKRKWVDNEYNNMIKKHDINITRKRKMSDVLIHRKKQKLDRCCLVHEEKYICNIYECDGVKTISDAIYMPYIV